MSEDMKHGTYVGREEKLKGETALLRINPQLPEQVQAQFDNLELEYNGVNLAHGWHIFPLAAFEVDPEPAEDDDEQE
ncbi:MAG: hypothetical protein RBT55_03525 [Rhodocyclaceae bacterium]|jgi:hypothetical protein|nr:hypothetical protein [Rhodocyclaceae bacterium]